MAVNPEQFKALYHGTTAQLAVGDTIHPTPDHIYGGEDKAYATKNLKSAGTYGGSKAAHDPNVYPQVMRDGKAKDLPSQGSLFAPVYKVEPLGAVEPSPSGSESDVTSRKGLRITGVAAYQRTDDMSKHPFDQDLL